MLKIIETNKATPATIHQVFERPSKNMVFEKSMIKNIFEDVKKNGDKAIQKYTLQFDKVMIPKLQVEAKEIEDACQRVPDALKKAIQAAAKNIKKFHLSQKEAVKKIKICEGVTCWRESRPIERIGIYIPGGTAPLFSTVLMLGIPAQIAACQEIMLVSPPNQKGNIDDAILYAANLVGIKKIFKCGGIQAIAGLTFGTQSILPVYKIFGPGNSFVTAAKLEALQYGIAIDMPAGPSELMIIADANAKPEWVAADVLAQLEHGMDSQVVIICETLQKGKLINNALQKQLKNLIRNDVLQESLKNSILLIENNFQQQLLYINQYAPEHLILNVKEESKYISKIQNAGSVFLGQYSAEAFGDYASGTNHTLPTNGYAKAYSGVSLDSFIKKITFQKIEPKGVKILANIVETMAHFELLDAHKNSVTIRK